MNILNHLRLGQKDFDELISDNFAFLLRILYPFQSVQKFLLGIKADHVDLKIAPERFLDRGLLILAQQSVINEDAMQPVPDGLMNKHRGHRRIHPPA